MAATSVLPNQSHSKLYTPEAKLFKENFLFFFLVDLLSTLVL